VKPLLALVPTPPSTEIDWEQLRSLVPSLKTLSECPQDPTHHGEGDVGIHTRMVCDSLVNMPAWQQSCQRKRGSYSSRPSYMTSGSPSRPAKKATE
jgi:hypothetical protein